MRRQKRREHVESLELWKPRTQTFAIPPHDSLEHTTWAMLNGVPWHLCSASWRQISSRILKHMQCIAMSFCSTKTMIGDFVGTWRGPYRSVYIHICFDYVCLSICLNTEGAVNKTPLAANTLWLIEQTSGVIIKTGCSKNWSRADEKHKDGRPHGPSTRWPMALQNAVQQKLSTTSGVERFEPKKNVVTNPRGEMD